MQDLLKTIFASGCSRVGAILHVGAGTCRELGDFLTLGPEKVMLVEADPEKAAGLAAAVRGIKGVEIVNAAVAPAEGQAVFWLVNNARESSLHRPTNLLTRYPNLRVIRSVTVPAVTLTQLVDRLDADAEDENLLVMELQGAELSVLAATAREVLWQFSWIALRASVEPLYLDGARLEDVDALLAKNGYRAASPSERDTASPFQEILYRRDSREIRLHELTLQVATQESAIGALQRDLANQRSENADLVERAANLEQQLAKAGEALAQNASEIERLTRERDENLEHAAALRRDKESVEEQLTISTVAHEALHRDKAALVDRITALEEELASSTRASATQTRLAEERAAELERRAAEQVAHLGQIAALQGHVAALEIRLADSVRSHDEQSRLAEERRTQIERLDSAQGAHAEKTAALEQRTTTLETQLAISMKSHEDQSRLAEERRREVERLAREQGASAEQVAALQQRNAALETQLAASLKSNEDQFRLTEERRREVERLAREQVASAEQVAALQQRTAASETQLAATLKSSEDQFRLAEERRREMERLTSERDSLAADLARLESDRSELDHRQELLDEEMVKAEAQIDLIKDVLLREKAL